jgi:hypothetical protein
MTRCGLERARIRNPSARAEHRTKGRVTIAGRAALAPDLVRWMEVVDFGLIFPPLPDYLLSLHRADGDTG